MNKYDIYLIYRITNWQTWHLCVLRLRKNHRIQGTRLQQHPTCPAVQTHFEWYVRPQGQMEMEIQTHSKDTQMVHWTNVHYSMMMNIFAQNEWTMKHVPILFEEWPGQKKRVFGLSESGMRGIQEVEEEPWIKSALEAEVWKWIESESCESVGCVVYFGTEKKTISECLISAHPAGIDKVLRSFNETGKHCEHWMLDMLDAWVLSRDAATWSTVL